MNFFITQILCYNYKTRCCEETKKVTYEPAKIENHAETFDVRRGNYKENPSSLLNSLTETQLHRFDEDTIIKNRSVDKQTNLEVYEKFEVHDYAIRDPSYNMYPSMKRPKHSKDTTCDSCRKTIEGSFYVNDYYIKNWLIDPKNHVLRKNYARKKLCLHKKELIASKRTNKSAC